MKKPLVLSVMVLLFASLAAAADWTADFEPNVPAPAGLSVVTVVGTNAAAAASVGVELVRRETDRGVKVSGRVTNRTADRRLVRFSLPGFKHVKVRGKPRLYLPYGLGARVSDFPKSAADADKKLWKDLGDGTLECDPVWWHRLDFWYPSARRSMSYLALEGEGETVYVACEDPAFGNKLVHVVYDPAARDFSFRVEYMLALVPGESADLPPAAMERLDGDWHAAAKRYRRWSDTAFRPSAAAGRDATSRAGSSSSSSSRTARSSGRMRTSASSRTRRSATASAGWGSSGGPSTATTTAIPTMRRVRRWAAAPRSSRA